MSAYDILSQSAQGIFGDAMAEAKGNAEVAAMLLAERVKDAEEKAERAMAALSMQAAQGGDK